MKHKVVTPKEEAEDLVNHFRMILMNEDTECGNEILCTSIAKKCALETVERITGKSRLFWEQDYDYWKKVTQEIKML